MYQSSIMIQKFSHGYWQLNTSSDTDNQFRRLIKIYSPLGFKSAAALEDLDV